MKRSSLMAVKNVVVVILTPTVFISCPASGPPFSFPFKPGGFFPQNKGHADFGVGASWAGCAGWRWGRERTARRRTAAPAGRPGGMG